MNYAVVDLGSNSIRLSVYECDNYNIQKTFSYKELAGLAGYVSKGILNEAGIRKACTILNNIKDIATAFARIEDIHVFATASLRNVINGHEAVKIISEETALVPVILSGDEEAALGFYGVTRYVNCYDGIMIDIGGASTELVLFRGGKIEKTASLPIGCLNLVVKSVSQIIPKEQERKRIDAEIKKRFSKIGWAGKEKLPIMVGVGGTLRALLALSRTLYDVPDDVYEIKPDFVRKTAKLIAANKDGIYLSIYSTIPERLMTISTGLAILSRAIKVFGCETISVSNFGIREGYLLNRVLSAGDEYVISHRVEDD